MSLSRFFLYNLNVSNGSIVNTNAVSTNITTATLNALTGITSATAQITNVNATSLTASNLMSNNVNLGIASLFSGSFSASNNTSIPANVTGFTFVNADTRSFQSTVTVTVVRSVGGNLYEQFVIYGFQTDAGWTLYTSKLGDDSGFSFNITSSGQIQYTSTNVTNFTSSTVRYSVTQISNTGSYSFSGMSSGGTVLIDSVQIQNTQNSIIGTNTGSLYVLGGSTLTKTVNVLTTENAIGLIGVEAQSSVGNVTPLGYGDVDITGNTSYSPVNKTNSASYSDVDVTAETSYTDVTHVA